MKTTEQTLQAEYRNRFERSKEYRAQVWRILCNDFFSTYIPASSRVLDVGCGWGEFINHIQAREKHAIDLNPDAADKLASEVKFHHQDCSATWPIEDGALDIVFSSNFLEHLPNKQLIDRTLAEAYRALKPGGVLMLMGPNIRYAAREYWDFWDHHIPISDRSIAEAASLCGFKILRQTDRFLPFTMSGTKETPTFLIRAYLRMPFVWRWFGKQFFVVCRK